MGVLRAIQTRVQPLRERRKNRVLSRKGDVFLEDDEKTILEHVRRFPESCSRKFSFEGHCCGKQYPLFVVACRRKVSLELIHTLHECYPEAIEGALHYALRSKQTTLPVIQYLLKETPNQRLAQNNGYLPIHTALEHRARLEVVKFLVDEHPECVRKREPNTQRLPLHLAIDKRAGFGVIQFLVSRYKDALKQADYEIQSVVEEEGWLAHQGRFYQDLKCGLPLHAACKRRASLKVIQFLVSEYPAAVSTKNRAGWLPLHFACAFGAQPIVIEYVITACPDALLERTNFLFAEYPTHLAAGRPDADLETIKLLIGKHPIQQNEKPKSAIYASYMDDAYHNEAHPFVVQFLRRVVRSAESGYYYVPTREERFRNTARVERAHPVRRDAGNRNEADTSSETTILLGQTGLG